MEYTEIELNQHSHLWYPRKRTMWNDGRSNGKKEPIENWPDLINGYLQPIIYQLKRGKEIKVNSHEHKLLKELLEKANNI